jgi:hypothetical protein
MVVVAQLSFTAPSHLQRVVLAYVQSWSIAKPSWTAWMQLECPDHDVTHFVTLLHKRSGTGVSTGRLTL